MNSHYQEYFNYYLELEKDFFQTESYVTVDEDNFVTFSVQYNRIYQSICSEIDSLLKVVCGQVEAQCNPGNIGAYCRVIQEHFKFFNEETVYFHKSRILLQPWKDWTEAKAPAWWTMYNKVKHHRTELHRDTEKPYYKYANLENVLHALAALYVVEEYFVYSYDFSEEEMTLKRISRMSLEESKEQSLEVALEMTQSKMCVMKQWQEAGCYSGFMGQRFFVLEKLQKIMETRE